METPITLKMSGAGVSHVGKVRQRNEDAIYVDPMGRFALLADGMGGHAGGQYASKITIDFMAKAIRDFFVSENEDCGKFLRNSFIKASEFVYQTGEKNIQYKDMGTTLVAWVFYQDKIYLAHVGDSRAYLVRNKQIFQSTMDHTFINEQINRGIIRSQVANFVHSNTIFRNIGMHPPSEAHITEIIPEVGDYWIMCSDGLTGKVKNDEILSYVNAYPEVIKSTNFGQVLRGLVTLAYDRGGEDNISVLMLAIV